MLASISSFFHLSSDESKSVKPSRDLKLDEIEAAEREWRAAQPQSYIDRAAFEASLIKRIEYPYFKAAHSGFLWYTRSLEEKERTRRIAAKAECYLRKRNCYKAAYAIRVYWTLAAMDKFVIDDYISLEEKERAYRLSNQDAALIARNNAAFVSLLIRVAFQVPRPLLLAGLAYTRFLEETERARRLADSAEMDLSSFHAHLVSELIRELGWPFFVSQVEVLVGPTVLESASAVLGLAKDAALRAGARAADVIVDAADQSAHNAAALAVSAETAAANALVSVADKASNTLDSAVDGAVAMAEIVSDAAMGAGLAAKGAVASLGSKISHAVTDAANVVVDSLASATASEIIVEEVAIVEEASPSVIIDASLEEELERMRRIADTEEERRKIAYARSVSNLIRPNVAVVEENERRRRMARSTSRHDRLKANEVAWVVEALLITKTLGFIEEQERGRRMYDTAFSSMAKANALKVSAMIVEADVGNRTVSLEEEERNRRMHSKQFQLLAKKHSRKVSRMIEKKFDRTLHASMGIIAPISPATFSITPAPVASYALTSYAAPVHNAVVIPAPPCEEATIVDYAIPVPVVESIALVHQPTPKSGFVTFVPPHVEAVVAPAEAPIPFASAANSESELVLALPPRVESIDYALSTPVESVQTTIVVEETVAPVVTAVIETVETVETVTETVEAVTVSPVIETETVEVVTESTYLPAPTDTLTTTYVAPVGQAAYQPAGYSLEVPVSFAPAAPATAATAATVAPVLPARQHGRLGTKFQQLRAHLHSNKTAAGNPSM